MIGEIMECGSAKLETECPEHANDSAASDCKDQMNRILKTANPILNADSGALDEGEVECNDSTSALKKPSSNALIIRISETGPETVRKAFLDAGWVLHCTNDSPESWHLWWRSSRFRRSEYASAHTVQRMNHFINSGAVTRKDQLLHNVRNMRAIFGRIFDFAPLTFILPNEYTKFVREYSKDHEERTMKDSKPAWICKPADLSRGRKIFLIQNLHELRYDQKCVIQKYIANPLTVGGYKVDLRVYVLVTSFHPLRIHVFKEGIARFGTEKYDENMEDITNLFSHLTNSSINKHSSTFDDVKEVIGSGAKWTFSEFEKWFDKHKLNFALVWERIVEIVSLTLLSIVNKIPRNDACFELFGFDILLDKSLNPWLIEVNCAPALGVSEPADAAVKVPLMREMIQVLNIQPFQVKLPPGKRNINTRRKTKPTVEKVAAFCSSSPSNRRLGFDGKQKLRRQLLSRSKRISPSTRSDDVADVSVTSVRASIGDNQVSSPTSNTSSQEEEPCAGNENPLNINQRNESVCKNKFQLVFPYDIKTEQLANQMSEVARDSSKQKEYMSILRRIVKILREKRKSRELGAEKSFATKEQGVGQLHQNQQTSDEHTTLQPKRCQSAPTSSESTSTQNAIAQPLSKEPGFESDVGHKRPLSTTRKLGRLGQAGASFMQNWQIG